MKPGAAPSSPGGIAMPTKQAGKGEEDFGWKALDYAHGNKPLYAAMRGLMKNKDSTGSFCGQGAAPGGMAPPRNNAAQVAGMAAPGARGAMVNPDAVSPEVDPEEFVSNDFGGELM